MKAIDLAHYTLDVRVFFRAKHHLQLGEKVQHEKLKRINSYGDNFMNETKHQRKCRVELRVSFRRLAEQWLKSKKKNE